VAVLAGLVLAGNLLLQNYFRYPEVVVFIACVVLSEERGGGVAGRDCYKVQCGFPASK